LKDAEEILILTVEFSELDDAEKSEYRLQQPFHIFGSVDAVGSVTTFFSNSSKVDIFAGTAGKVSEQQSLITASLIASNSTISAKTVSLELALHKLIHP
jgi:hypothetical protein